MTGGAAVLLGVLVVAGATIPGTATARAAFSGTTASRPNALSVPVWPCPVLPSPGSAGGPGIAFSFNPTSGTAEPNRGVNGSAFSATAPAVDTRVGGGCAAGSTPSLRLPGSAGQAVVGGAVPASNQGTQTIWFSPTAATGVLQSVGGGTAASTDRQLYFTGDGRLGFAMRNGSAGIMTCTAPGAVALSTWHFAAVVYDTTAKTITLYLDGVQTLCPTLITTPANITAASRLGADLMLDTTAPTTPYSGSIDEAYAWGVPMTAAQVAQVRTAGH